MGLGVEAILIIQPSNPTQDVWTRPGPNIFINWIKNVNLELKILAVTLNQQVKYGLG